MADRPILFSAAMVRALFAGTKTQTRRIMKPQPFESGYYDGEIELTVIPATDQWPKAFHFNASAVGGDAILGEVFEPRIAVGDRLWVRESWSGLHQLRDTPPAQRESYATPDGPVLREEVWFWADGNPTGGDYERPRPGIHMPRWASRISLAVTDVRVERLQDISEADAIAEGIERHHSGWMPYSTAFYEADGVTPANYHRDARESYRQLWNKINGFGAWEANPWVVAYTFTVIKQKIDEIGRDAA